MKTSFTAQFTGLFNVIVSVIDQLLIKTVCYFCHAASALIEKAQGINYVQCPP